MCPRPVVRTALGAALAAAACSDRTGDPSAPAAAASGSASAAARSSSPARPTGPITVRDRDGAVIATIAVDGDARGSGTGATCTATIAGVTVTVTRDGDRVAVTAAGPAVRVERSAAGELVFHDDASVARIWRDPAQPGHLDVFDATGVPIVRASVTGATATVVDAARAELAHVAYQGGRFVVADPRDAVIAYVQGGDTELAALLASPVPADVRAVAACDRLLPQVLVPP